MADDELQEIRDNFYVGNFAKALSMCEGTTASHDAAQNELNAILARCCLSIPHFDRLRAMQNSECPGQQATALMAVILRAKKEEQRGSAKEKLAALAKQTNDMTCNLLHSISMAADGSWNDAVNQVQSPTLEVSALHVFFCLACNQVPAAERRLSAIGGASDDSAAFRLAEAAVKLATGNPEEAYLTYCDLGTQFPTVEGEEIASVLLQTGKALANMQRGMFGEAAEDLQHALVAAPTDPDVLVNLCCCAVHLNKQTDFAQHYAKLEQAHPSHPYVLKTQSISQEFQRFKASTAA